MNYMMNTKIQKIAPVIASLFLIGTILVSCNKENGSIDDNYSIAELSEAFETTEIDDISENVNDIVENAYFELASNNLSKSGDSKTQNENRFLSECVTITKVITSQNIQVTLDYGDACTTKKEDVLSGKIEMLISPNLEDQSIVIDYSFDDFYFNDKKIEGSVNKIRTRSNENGNPQAIINRDIKITWEDTSSSFIKGERKREWIEGTDNLLWADNVFSITGNWTITKRNGNIRTSNIVEPLIRNMACKFLVSGIVEIEKNDKKKVLDYGDGECNDLASLTVEGKTYEIHLRKRNR